MIVGIGTRKEKHLKPRNVELITLKLFWENLEWGLPANRRSPEDIEEVYGLFRVMRRSRVRTIRYP